MSLRQRRCVLFLGGLPALLGLLCACAQPGTLAPAPDTAFGQAVRAARQAQTINAGPPVPTDPTQGLDGKAAVNLIERYQDAFKSPPKTFEVLNRGAADSGP
jgi:hypothetical protein